jgi:hypothetical protein
MRSFVVLAFAAALSVAGCDAIRPKEEAKKAPETEVAAPPAKPAPMTPERLAVCAAALEAWAEAGAGKAPAGVSPEDARQAATLIGMRKMELALSDGAIADAAAAKALSTWQRMTPGEIEAGAAICMNEIRGK